MFTIHAQSSPPRSFRSCNKLYRFNRSVYVCVCSQTTKNFQFPFSIFRRAKHISCMCMCVWCHLNCLDSYIKYHGKSYMHSHFMVCFCLVWFGLVLVLVFVCVFIISQCFFSFRTKIDGKTSGKKSLCSSKI